MSFQNVRYHDEDLMNPESRPRIIASCLAAVQHIGICLVTLTFPRLVGETAGLSAPDLANYLKLSFLALAVSTFLQTLRTPISGSGYLLPSCFTLLYIPGALVAAKLGGLGAVAGMTIAAGLVEIMFSRFVRDLRVVLPPELIGIVILMIGISLALFALGQMTHNGATHQEFLISLFSLFVIIGVTIWGKGNLATFAALIGMLFGVIVTIAVYFSTETVEFNLPRIAILDWPMALPNFAIGIIPGILSGAIGCLVRCAGDVVASAQLCDKSWKRPDYTQISRGVMSDGLGTLFAGLIGVIGTNTYSGSVGLVAASKVAARRIGFFISAGWVLLALIPESTLLLILVPKGILGATLFFVALFVIRSGINLLSQRLFDSRKTILIGTALALGLSYDNIHLKDAFGIVHLSDTISPLLVALVSGIILNMVFRLGALKIRSRSFPLESNAESVNQFLLECGQSWGARSEAIFRASAVIEEVYEYLIGLEKRPNDFHMKVSFDELTIDMEISWQGSLPDGNQVESTHDDDVPLDEISMRLIRHHADQLKLYQDGLGNSVMKIQIDDQ